MSADLIGSRGPLDSHIETRYGTQRTLSVEIDDKNGDITIKAISKNIFQRLYNATLGKLGWENSPALQSSQK